LLLLLAIDRHAEADATGRKGEKGGRKGKEKSPTSYFRKLHATLLSCIPLVEVLLVRFGERREKKKKGGGKRWEGSIPASTSPHRARFPARTPQVLADAAKGKEGEWGGGKKRGERKKRRNLRASSSTPIIYLPIRRRNRRWPRNRCRAGIQGGREGKRGKGRGERKENGRDLSPLTVILTHFYPPRQISRRGRIDLFQAAPKSGEGGRGKEKKEKRRSAYYFRHLCSLYEARAGPCL